MVRGRFLTQGVSPESLQVLPGQDGKSRCDRLPAFPATPEGDILSPSPLRGEGEDAPHVQGLGSLRPGGRCQRTWRQRAHAQGARTLLAEGVAAGGRECPVAGTNWRWGFPSRSDGGSPDYPAAANAGFFRAGAGRFPPLGMHSRLPLGGPDSDGANPWGQGRTGRAGTSLRPLVGRKRVP